MESCREREQFRPLRYRLLEKQRVNENPERLRGLNRFALQIPGPGIQRGGLRRFTSVFIDCHDSPVF